MNLKGSTNTEINVKAYIMKAPIDMATVFWTMRDIQQGLVLNITGKYHGQWISSQWSSLTSYYQESLHLPVSHFLRSATSQKAKEQQAASSSEARPDINEW
eukprot:8497494-Lingulodinium_polyedra.AAC.1